METLNSCCCMKDMICPICKPDINIKIESYDFDKLGQSCAMDDFNEFFECSVCCFDKNLMVLNCGHSICIDCCRKSDECPLCRAEIKSKIANFDIEKIRDGNYAAWHCNNCYGYMGKAYIGTCGYSICEQCYKTSEICGICYEDHKCVENYAYNEIVENISQTMKKTYKNIKDEEIDRFERMAMGNQLGNYYLGKLYEKKDINKAIDLYYDIAKEGYMKALKRLAKIALKKMNVRYLVLYFYICMMFIIIQTNY